MATKSVKKKVKSKKSKVKKVLKDSPVKKKSTPKKSVVKENPAKKKVTRKKKIIKKTDQPVVKKSVKKTVVTGQKKVAKKPLSKTIAALTKAAPVKNVVVPKPKVTKPVAAKPVVKHTPKKIIPNKTTLFPPIKINRQYEQLKFWFIVFFVILVVLLFSQYSGGLVSRTFADLKSEIITNPVVCSSGDYYKYEAPAQEWEYFSGEQLLKNIQQSGIIFDEGWYQEGGQVCDACNASAAPLIYIKNPSQPLPEPWVQVAQPGFYGNNQYTIHHYY